MLIVILLLQANNIPHPSVLKNHLLVSKHGGDFFHIIRIGYFATSTLQNELLVINEQQKVGLILIFAAKIEKKAKYARTFLIF
mgnify:FL=1